MSHMRNRGFHGYSTVLNTPLVSCSQTAILFWIRLYNAERKSWRSGYPKLFHGYPSTILQIQYDDSIVILWRSSADAFDDSDKCAGALQWIRRYPLTILQISFEIPHMSCGFCKVSCDVYHILNSYHTSFILLLILLNWNSFIPTSERVAQKAICLCKCSPVGHNNIIGVELKLLRIKVW